MTKNISSALQTSLEAPVMTNAMCVEIVRKDGRIYRMTDHSTDIVFEGSTYSASIPFTVGTIDSGSNFATDNTDLGLFCDETTFKLADFKAKLFDNAKTKIFWLDTETPTDGQMIGRQGWFGPISYDENSEVNVTVLGLMKLLDFEVVRVYQVACDADLGDKRCKVSTDLSQSYDVENEYTVGDWAYVHDTSVMTTAAMTNGDFSTDGTTSAGDDITGWTAVGTDAFQLGTTAGTLSPQSGTRVLFGGADGGDADNNHTSTMYQDTDISGWGTTQIDAGELVYALFYDVGAWTNNQSGIKVKIEMMNAAGDVLYFKDPGWEFFDDFAVWHAKAIITPIIALTRTIRVYIQMVKIEDTQARVAIDDVRAFYYDGDLVDPHNSLIYKMEQVNTPGGATAVNTSSTEAFTNTSFEEDAPVTLGLTPAMTGWTVESGWAQLTGSAHTLTAEHGSYFLSHGDDGSAGAHNSVISQTVDFETFWTNVDLTQVDDGSALFTLFWRLGFGDTALSAFRADIAWFTSADVIIGTAINLVSAQTGAAGAWTYESYPVIPPATARKLKLAFTFTAPATGLGTASVDLVGCDVRAQNVIARGADVTASGDAATVFSTVASDITQDGDLLWKGHAQRFAYDTVNVVTDKKTFSASSLSGTDATYQFGKILWLSGSNAGQESVVRIFTNSTSLVKLYFPVANTIVSGDRFMIIEGCSKDFTTDCLTRFNNAINFRGFPYVPGRLIEADAVVQPDGV